MRISLAFVVLLVGCGSAQMPNGTDRGWYCLRASNSGARTSACYRTRSDCTASNTHGWVITQMCAPEPIAYCLPDSEPAPGPASSCFAEASDCTSASGTPVPCSATN